MGAMMIDGIRIRSEWMVDMMTNRTCTLYSSPRRLLPPRNTRTQSNCSARSCRGYKRLIFVAEEYARMMMPRLQWMFFLFFLLLVFFLTDNLEFLFLWGFSDSVNFVFLQLLFRCEIDNQRTTRNNWLQHTYATYTSIFIFPPKIPLFVS